MAIKSSHGASKSNRKIRQDDSNSFVDDCSQIPSEPRGSMQRYNEKIITFQDLKYEKLQMQRLIARTLKRENSQLIIIQDREHLFTRMSFDKNITAISRSSSGYGYSNISRRLNDIICEEKYEGEEITISKSRIQKDSNNKNVRFMQESILEPSSGKGAVQ